MTAGTTRPAVWPMSSAVPPLGPLVTAPRLARSCVRGILSGWDLSNLTDTAELVVTELVTNGVRASQDAAGRPLYRDGRMLVIRVCLFADGTRLRCEVWDQSAGVPALRDADGYAESGRGLALIHAVTDGRWGWHPSPAQPGKCVWAEMQTVS